MTLLTDLDLYRGSNLGVRVYATKRSYPKVGVGQYESSTLDNLKNYAHFENLNIVLTRTPTRTRTQTPTRTDADATTG